MTDEPGLDVLARPPEGSVPSRLTALAEFCQRLVLETYVPAAVLINGAHDCLYSMGPTDRYLSVAPGYATHNILAMAREGLRTELAAAIGQATRDNARVLLVGGRMDRQGTTIRFSIDVQPVVNNGDHLMLVCFAEVPNTEPGDPAGPACDHPAASEPKPEDTILALQGAILRQLLFLKHDAPPPLALAGSEEGDRRDERREIVLPQALPPPERAAQAAFAPPSSGTSRVFVVDDDRQIRVALRAVLEEEGLEVEEHASGESFLAAYQPGGEVCLLIDASLPGMSGLDVLEQLSRAGHRLPVIMVTGHGDVPLAIKAMKAGALDFIQKPIGRVELLASVNRGFEQARAWGKLSAGRDNAVDLVAGLTIRQREIMGLVLAGQPSKNIAADLGLSQRTVENHRASIMKKTGTKSLPALARLALMAAWEAPAHQDSVHAGE